MPTFTLSEEERKHVLREQVKAKALLGIAPSLAYALEYFLLCQEDGRPYPEKAVKRAKAYVEEAKKNLPKDFGQEES